jgi:peptidoglycan/xylan/chitin deacetylase (PgdA/CDA1 family)
MPPKHRIARLSIAALLVSAVVVVGGHAPTIEAASCSSRGTRLVYKVNTTAKLVALTFDDGPATGVTAKILDVLKERNVKATFFVLGRQVERNQSLAVREVAEGHEIGNHSWSHPAYNPKKVIGELDKTTQMIQQVTGVTPTLFRAPYGCMSKALDKAVAARGMLPIQWNTQSWDSRSPAPSKKTICKNALKGAKPGSIIVFHDSGPYIGRGSRKNTLDALPCIIDGFRAKGFEMVTVSELLAHAGQ